MDASTFPRNIHAMKNKANRLVTSVLRIIKSVHLRKTSILAYLEFISALRCFAQISNHYWSVVQQSISHFKLLINIKLPSTRVWPSCGMQYWIPLPSSNLTGICTTVRVHTNPFRPTPYRSNSRVACYQAYLHNTNLRLVWLFYLSICSYLRSFVLSSFCFPACRESAREWENVEEYSRPGHPQVKTGDVGNTKRDRNKFIRLRPGPLCLITSLQPLSKPDTAWLGR